MKKREKQAKKNIFKKLDIDFKQKSFLKW